MGERYLLDTNVVSEQVRPRPDPAVVAWMDSLDPEHTLVSTITVGEIQKGVLNLGAGPRRSFLARWLDQIPVRFADRVLPVDTRVARAWGRIAYEGDRAGREIGTADGLLLATARVHQLVVVTRNERHFHGRGVRILNPWRG